MVKLFIKTLQGNILPIRPSSYTIEDGFVCFVDPKDNHKKKFPVSNVEIVDDGDTFVV